MNPAGGIWQRPRPSETQRRRRTPLTAAQLARFSPLLDEALPLDETGRRRWLETLAAEHHDLAAALRSALLPTAREISGLKALDTLHKFGRLDGTDSAAASGLQPGARVGPYELIRLLGAGGMAEVWLAQRADGAFRREVALKLPMLTRMRKDLEQRFARERDILASLEHPKIARFYDAGIDSEGLPYLSMEYVQGQPLTTRCDAQCLSIPARLVLLLQVLDAVKYAHQKQIIHMDLKPSNILVTDSDQVRLLDFGVAKLLESDEPERPQLTHAYGRALTPEYASPELLRGDPVDQRSDVYALGVLLYELLTGARPYRLKAGAWSGILEQAIATVDVKRPSTQLDPTAGVARATTNDRLVRSLRGDLDAITLKAIAKEPCDRYASAEEFAADLQRYLDAKPITARPPRLLYRLRKCVRRHRASLGFATALGLVIVMMAGYESHRWATDQAKGLSVVVNPKLPGNNSIAVLPFVDMSEKHDQEYFADGMSEELLDLLAQVPDLKVPARTSSFYFKGKQATVKQIARSLGVAHVLEGSVRKAGNTIRVTVQLVRADNGYHVWSKSYDRDLKGIFKVQDEIAGAVVEALKVKLAPTQRVSTYRTSNPEAYNEFLLGRQFHNRGNLDSYRRSIEAYRKAIALDPSYGSAYAGLAVSEAYVADDTGDAKGMKQAEEASEKAIALAPDEAAGYAARADLRASFGWDWAGARADLEKALSLDPSDGEAQRLYGDLLASLGRLPEAIAAQTRATQLDPLSSPAWEALGWYLAQSRDFAAAHEALRRALEIEPESARSRNYLGTLQLLEGKAVEALTTFRKITDDEVFRLQGVAMAQHRLKDANESQRALQELISRHAKDSAYQIADAFAWCGEKDNAFEWLERAYQQRDGGLASVKVDPLLESLYGDPRYQALLRKLRLAPEPERQVRSLHGPPFKPV